ncbi:GNAT family N-acetyltransferase [Sphingobacterium sp. SG20118]|uniref:GNAT family N-acetyltransferase n=1 Tax=Sphingobacterium sp. SG20118 TaxID=3367156 RepID=UPI0037DFC155
MITSLNFKKYKTEDFRDYYNLVKEDTYMKYITGEGMSKENAIKRFEYILDFGRQHDAIGYFQVRDVETNSIIGDSKLVYNKDDKSLFEIGYLLKEEYWRKGLGTKICAYLLALASTIDEKKDIIGIIHPENIASRRLLEKFGFKSIFKGDENGATIEKLILKRNGED